MNTDRIPHPSLTAGSWTNRGFVGFVRTTSVLLALASAFFSSTAMARDFRPNMMPNGNAFSCANCHISPFGGGPRNAFGRDVETIVGSSGAAIPFWSPALAARDSDGDGFTNGEELGDPDGDGTAQPGARVTNPGLATSRPPENSAPTVQITRPANGASFESTASIELEATATDSDGTVARVEFIADGNLISTANSAPYVATISGGTLAVGSHSLAARAIDNQGASTTSAPVQITVSAPANQLPAVQITSPNDGAVFDLDATVEIEASANDSDGNIAKVDFIFGRNVLFSATTAPYVLRIAAAELGTGSHTISVVATDSAGAGSAAATIQITIAEPGPGPGPDPEPPAPVSIAEITRSGESLQLKWTGGSGPFIVQQKQSLSAAEWFNSKAVAGTEATLNAPRDMAFLRVADMRAHEAIPFTASLTGAAERPNPVNTDAAGSATLRLEGNRLFFDVEYHGLSGPAVAAHIHGPAPASGATGVLIDLAPFNGGAFGQSGTLSGSVELSTEQKAMVLNSETYINVHTAANPGGEIRGQVAPAIYQAVLSGANERPTPVDTDASGSGTLLLAGNQLTFNIVYSGLSGPAVAAHIHGPASADASAPPIIDLAPFNGGAFGESGRLAGTVTLTPDQIAALVDGLTYVNVHTAANPGGEIRGQIRSQVTAVPLSASLSGAAERPNPVTTTASGLGLFRLEGDTLIFHIEYGGLSGTASAAHIHGPAPASEATGVIINLAPFNGGAFGTSGTLSGAVTLSSDQRTMILDGLTYVNIHTAANPGGEIRGQIVPVVKSAELSGANERPDPVTTDATGSGTLLVIGDQLQFNVTYRGLSGTAVAAHIHGPAGSDQTAPPIIDLAPFNGGSFGASGALFGSVELTPDQLAAIADGLTYVNVHTPANPGGEIRGQVD